MEATSALGQDSLRRAVRTAGIESEPVWLEETGSTNSDLLAGAERGAPEWTVLATGHQTAGRGRLGRSWSDVPGTSLLLSVLLLPDLPPERAPLLTLLAAVSMIEASGLPAMRSKWPNDLMVGDRKVGGILAEAAVSEGRIRHVVIGTGLNLAASGLPEDRSSTSVAGEGGEPDAEGILTRYLTSLRQTYEDPDFPDAIVERYAQRCSTIGRQVGAITERGAAVEGLAKGLDERGSLLVRTDDGVEAVSFGEVVHLRTV